jgi:DNA modification methylase
MSMELDRIHNTDALTLLRALPDESINCCVTSPPYFGLRDYGTDGQIGLEETPQQYVDALVTVFRELRRVLRSDGTFWLNIGDSYAGSGKGGQSSEKRSANWQPEYSNHGARYGFKAKDRMMIPARLAIALQDDGWWLRDEIVWHKPNPMPSPVDDRTTTAHEMVYLLTKQPRYWYDAEAIAEPASNTGGGDFMRALNRVQLQHGGESRTGRWARDKRQQQATRNRRSVWTISPEPFPAGHFAVMPPKLVELCVLAGCPPDGVVIDPFMGAGTVALVARQLKRRWIGSEINAEYVRLANMRLQGRLDEYIAEQRGKPFMPYMFTEGAQP